MRKNSVPEDRLLEIIKNENPFSYNESPPKPDEKIPKEKTQSPRQFLFITTILLVVILGSAFYIFYSKNLNSNKTSKKEISPKNVKSEKSNIPTKKIKTQDIDLVTIDAPIGFNLLGIIEGDVPSAIIEDKYRSRTYTLEINENLLGYKLIRIKKGEVTFSNKNNKFSLNL